MAGKVHKTLRLDSTLDDAIHGLKREGESDNAAYVRALRLWRRLLKAPRTLRKPHSRPARSKTGNRATRRRSRL